MTETRIRVLLVDDEPDLADLTATFLTREDSRFDVDTANDGAEGRDRLADEEYDCIVSDYEMPGMNGIEFLKFVREGHSDLPFILFTGKGSEEIASEAISAGVTDYLQKESATSQYTVLANRIANVVDQYRSRRALQTSQQRLSLFFEQSPLGVIEWDADSRVVRINDAAEDMFGYSEDKLKGRTWDLLVPEADRSTVEAVVTDLLNEDGGYHSINSNVRKDGQRIVCEWHNRVVTDDEGEVVSVFSQCQDITERVQRDRELRRRERRFEAMFNDPNILVGLLDPDGTVLDINQTAMSYIDVPLSEIVGEPFWETPWFEGDDAVQGRIQRWVERAATGEYVKFEEDLSDLLDDNLVISGYLRPVVNDEGDVTSILISDRDITDRKERQRELERYETILEALGDPVYALDAAGRYTFVNDAWVEHTGVDRDEIIGEHVSAIVDDEDIERGRAVVRDLLDDDERDKAMWTMNRVTADSDRTLHENHVALLPNDEDGRFRGTAGVIRDISEQAMHERRLTQLNKAASDLFQADSREDVARTTVEAATEILGYNRALVRLLDDDGSALVPTAVPEGSSVRLDERPIYAVGEATAGRAFSDGEVLVYEDVQELDDGYPRNDARAAMYLPIGEYGTISITETEPGSFDRNKIELAQILAANAAAALDRIQQRDELFRQNERLEEFVHVISHDLQNPINVAVGRLELARAECESPHLDSIERAHDRMQTLIDELLTLARVGHSVTEPEPIDLATVVEHSWDTVETDGSTLTLETDRTILADPSRLKQLLENLIRNAVEHGGEDIDVTVGALENQSGWFLEDTGSGIPDDERHRVFESGHSTKPEGTGFGLAIVKQIADAHEWNVHLTDSESGGARFEFSNVDVDDPRAVQ